MGPGLHVANQWLVDQPPLERLELPLDVTPESAGHAVIHVQLDGNKIGGRQAARGTGISGGGSRACLAQSPGWLSSHPEGIKLTGSGHGPDDMPGWDAAAEAKFRDWYSTRKDQVDRLDLAVVDKASGEAVGEAVLNDWDPGNRSCNFRIMLGPRGRNRGLGTESVRMIVGYGFEQLRLHRISLEVYSHNPRARRVYEKVGFVAAGVLRDALRWGSEWIDATVMSILASEWERHHGHPWQS
jgi:RimJ/RimL family protein N-acetyltransferase